MVAVKSPGIKIQLIFNYKDFFFYRLPTYSVTGGSMTGMLLNI